MISFFQFLIKYLFGTFCVHMTASGEKKATTLPINTSLRTSALCRSFDSYKALCTDKSTICGPRDGESGKLRSTNGGESPPSKHFFRDDW